MPKVGGRWSVVGGRWLVVRGLFVLLVGFASSTLPLCAQPNPVDYSDAEIRFGAEVLADRGFDILQGRRVGLITNHSATVDSTHLIDALHKDPGVDLVALFGPEHGLRGLDEAGDAVSNGIDESTGIAVYSLYGENRQPPDSVLSELDVLVFDIQDIGARFYTYISTMGLAMQAAAKNGVPFVVLDRPNPLGDRVAGPVREPGYESFVGLYPIPIMHGMTVGGLAVAIRDNDWLDDLEGLDLTVIQVSGWNSTWMWPRSERDWVPPSPNIPDFETALIYPGTCLIEGTIWSEGRGTPAPFKLIGYPGADGVGMASRLNAIKLPGVAFEAATFTPVSIPGKSSNPKHEDVEVSGIRIIVTDHGVFEPVRTGIEVVKAALAVTPADDQDEFFKERWFDLLAGTSELRQSIESDLR